MKRIFGACTFLFLAMLALPTFANSVVPTYAEEDRIESTDVPKYQEALLLQAPNLSLRNCPSTKGNWQLTGYFLRAEDTNTKWYLLNTESPLIVMTYVKTASNTVQYPQTDLQIMFHTSKDFKTLETVESFEYITDYERKNVGTLAAPEVKDVLVTRLVKTSNCNR